MIKWNRVAAYAVLIIGIPLGILLMIALGAGAQTADIPALTGTGNYSVEVASYSSDGATIPAGGTQYFSPFGDSAPRNTETDVLVPASFAYTATNLRVSANVAGCGTSGIGNSITFILRVNQVNTALSITCLSTTPANTILLDSDTVSISAGDRVSFSVTQTSIVGVALRIGLSMEGVKSVTVTTSPVVDMTNEMLDTVTAFLPLLAFIAAVIWAEATREFFVYVFSVIIGAAAAIALFPYFPAVLFAVVGATFLMVLRGFDSYKQTLENDTE